MPFKKFKMTLIFIKKKNVCNFFIACCSLSETDKYSPFNFFFKLSEVSEKCDTVTLNTLRACVRVRACVCLLSLSLLSNLYTVGSYNFQT